MSTAAEILVIILSVFLAIFLVLGIILLIYLIRLSAEIRRITEAARRTMDSVESAVVGVSRFVSPTILAATFQKQIMKFIKQMKKDKK